MYNPLQLISKYLRYYITASNGRGHGIHSPFVFDFIRTVLNDRTRYEDYDRIEAVRKKMLTDSTVLTVQDMGAGSSTDKSNHRTVASIARNAVKPKKYGQLLYRMARRYRSQSILELGTSLGITSAYLASGGKGRVVTLEGSPSVASIARHNFDSLGLSSIQLIEGNFDTTLLAVLEGLPSPDLVFIDGNHRREPTERYFEQVLSHVSAHTIIVLDDIHWSREMERAWEQIRGHSAVRCSVDLFFIGILFFREEFKEKQDFVIRF